MGRYDNKVKKTSVAGQSVSPRGGCFGGMCLLTGSHACTSECTGGAMKLPMKSETGIK